MKNFLANFGNAFSGLRQKLSVFMSGRYGNDELGRFLTIVWFVLILAASLFSVLGADPWAVILLDVICLALAGLVFFRFLSKNIFKRSAENDRYIKLKYKVTEFFRLQKLRWRERKTHVYKKCPSCKKIMRLPRINGRHTVRCPMCSSTYKIKIRFGQPKQPKTEAAEK